MNKKKFKQVEKIVRKNIKLTKVNANITKINKDKYLQYVVNKIVKDSINAPPEIAIDIIRRLLFDPRLKPIIINSNTCPYFDDWVKKYADFVLGKKGEPDAGYDKIEALSDYNLGRYNPNKYYKYPLK